MYRCPSPGGGHEIGWPPSLDTIAGMRARERNRPPGGAASTVVLDAGVIIGAVDSGDAHR
jgi:hypothetical protein